MPRLMSVWRHPTHKVYYIREPIPADLQAAAGGKQTYKRSLGVKTLPEARKLYQDALDAFKAYLASLRSGPKRLTAAEVEALVGVWYRENLEAWSADPGAAEHWEAAALYLPGGDDPGDDVDRARFVKPYAERLLHSHNLSVDAGSFERLADRLFRRMLDLFERMAMRAGGNFSPDPVLAEFPPWAPAALVAGPGGGLTFDAMFERWTNEVERAPGTVTETRAILRAFQEHVGHDDPAKVETADVERWRDALLIKGPSGQPLRRSTVQRKYLAALSTVYRASQGRGRGRLSGNPVEGAWFRGRQFSDSEEVRAYNADEVARILRACRHETLPELRWLPWLMVYTGARFREAVQCVDSDIREHEGIVYLSINRDHEWKRVKGKPGQASPSLRDVPLHRHLMAEGFGDYVKSLDPTGFLFPRLKPRPDGRPNEGRPVTSLRTWVAKFAMPDEGSRQRTSPTHSFRHTFEDLLRHATEDEELRRDIQGRSDGSSARGYGDGHSLKRKQEVIERIRPLC